MAEREWNLLYEWLKHDLPTKFKMIDRMYTSYYSEWLALFHLEGSLLLKAILENFQLQNNVGSKQASPSLRFQQTYQNITFSIHVPYSNSKQDYILNISTVSLIILHVQI
jgi:hypothetical protein